MTVNITRPILDIDTLSYTLDVVTLSFTPDIVTFTPDIVTFTLDIKLDIVTLTLPGGL